MITNSIKIFLLVLLVACVGIIIYNQKTESVLVQNVKTADTVEKPNKNTSTTPTTVDSEEKIPYINKEKTLDLSGKGLMRVPEYVFSKTDIEKLDLSNNKLDGSVQAEIRHLQNLRVLNLSHNQLTGVPAEVGQLKKLEILDLSNNRLTGLPLEIGNLSNLKVLKISGNEYSEYDLKLIKEKLPASTVIE
jgi:Leucine-rich repeat (LRR) protein